MVLSEAGGVASVTVLWGQSLGHCVGRLQRLLFVEVGHGGMAEESRDRES